ncbi:hypothetical protein PORY_001212 [Pneumocystis oryctolagi]|uniref:Uncharacterized protein n=1 Tax=Pneumocystis oryctolagi TaxID=42067 RepID=A0ACB7CD11_9ASCO|nr:hypothetical protein PORY_001212 [Pneumocystis oryctolagi]
MTIVNPKIYKNKAKTEPNTYVSSEEMIFLFSSLSYLPSVYINSSLSPATSLIDAQNIVTNLISSLELVSLSTIDQLRQSLNEIIQQSPQLNHDVQHLHNNIISFSKILNEKKQQIEILKKKMKSNTIDYFINLEIIKQRIQETYFILEKAKKWKNIETEKKHIELLIKNNSFQEAQNTINELKNLVDVWKETNEYNERLNIIKKLEEELSVSLKR